MYGDVELTSSSLPTYLSRVVPVPSRLAPVLFERWWHDARRQSRWTEPEVIDTPRGQLALDPLTWHRATGVTAMSPYRRVCGKARVRGGRVWPVELELGAWSASHSEIGLRFTGRRVRRGSAVARYHALGESVLVVLEKELVDLRSIIESEARRNAA